MTSEKDNLIELNTGKTLNLEEAFAIAKRGTGTMGVLVMEHPNGRVTCIEIGEPTHRDVLFYAEHLRNYTIHDYVDALNEDEDDGTG